MALKAGTLSDFDNSMAKAMEDALGVLWLAKTGQPLTSAAQGRSVSRQFLRRSFVRFPCWSQASWNISTKRTPRSTSRRASKQVLAKDDLPGSAPYRSSTC